jgi:uncharacterized membrane protein HdeD (DUF308 family)
MDALNALAKQLEPIFKALPALPKGAKDWLVKAWPVLAIIFGVLQLLAAWGLWHVGHIYNALTAYTNQMYGMYGISAPVNHLGLFYWVGLLVLVADAVILFMAYPGLKARSRNGWNMLLLSALVNALYGVLLAFNGSYDGVGRLISSLIGTAIALYFLYQVQSYYKTKTGGEKAS